ncbi:helix-turn-helix domain-containing protein [Desulfobacula toluolica]|uniref:Putative transcriptional regulator, XRE family n=1 Tax=Desulfobacula toluolica (strain DSM 7467 / Tol2) TaxID=651182 RepID=K0N402_DESTT|nr:XRE family transcriptional regulator [Desulfobacula toluolica]CCK78839.1 putative transcriptional regulator, XRE family [Desulfobacula toluolica Tol2]
MEKKDIPHINVDYFENLTGNIKNGETGDVEEVGKRIKELREERGISIEDLSHLTGFEVSKLQNIESGLEKPQLGTVMKLSKALDSAMGRLASNIGNKLYSITRKDERKEISRCASKTGKSNVYSYMSLAPEVQGRHMEALIVQLEKKQDQEGSIHNGEEFIFVLEGIINLVIGKDTYDLEPGDSAYYLSTTSHVLTAKTDKATILAVLYE